MGSGRNRASKLTASASHGKLIFGDVVVDQQGPAVVDHGFLHQCGRHPPQQSAECLAAGGLRAEDAACGIDPEHASQSDLPGDGVDADLGEVRAMGGVAVGALFGPRCDRAVGGEGTGSDEPGERGGAAAGGRERSPVDAHLVSARS